MKRKKISQKSFGVLKNRKILFLFISLFFGMIIISNFLAAQFLFEVKLPKDMGGGDTGYDPATGYPPYGIVAFPPEDEEIGYATEHYAAPGFRFTYEIPVKLIVHDDTGIDSYTIKWAVQSVEWGILTSPTLGSYSTIDSCVFTGTTVYDRELYTTLDIGFRYEHKSKSSVEIVFGFDFYISGSDTVFDKIQTKTLVLTFGDTDLTTYSSSQPPEDNTDPSKTMDNEDYLNDPAGNWEYSEWSLVPGFGSFVLMIGMIGIIIWRRRKKTSCLKKDESLDDL